MTGADPSGHRIRRTGDLDIETVVAGILNRRPAVGLALGVVDDEGMRFFRGHGLADIASNTPITEDTVFRIGSITKTFTAIAVMQLWEQGLVDLDAPTNEYLGGYRLVPADPTWPAVTVRHLLTHTAGIPEVLRLTDLFHPTWGPFDARPPIQSVEIGGPIPSLADCYRQGLKTVVEPGSDFAYSNHGFATLGQIVEDVSAVPLERYLREHIFEPLGMTDTDLVRGAPVRERLATGYVLESNGARAVIDRDWVGSGGGGAYSSSRDMALYVAALLGGGSNQHGSMLKPETMGSMLQPHYQPDPRLPGMGLAFFLNDAGRHRLVGHDGILPGFNSGLLIAPDDGVGVIGFTNGSKGAMVWLATEIEGLMRRLLQVPDVGVRSDVPQHPEIWDQLCGRYRLPLVGDLRGRLVMGGGAQVLARGGRLMIRLQTPVPALHRGFPLHPDDPTDPHIFRVDLSRFGMPTVRLVFGSDQGSGPTAIHTDLGGQPISLHKQPARAARRPSIAVALAALGLAIAARSLPRGRKAHKKESQK
jgi:CubicO group peptidase (beta-lactamase class C family)